MVGFCLSSGGPSRPVAFPTVVVQSLSRDNMCLLLQALPVYLCRESLQTDRSALLLPPRSSQAFSCGGQHTGEQAQGGRSCRVGERPRGVAVCVDNASRSHPANTECRMVPKGRAGGEVRKVRGRMC